jgi:hypothetical protein
MPTTTQPGPFSAVLRHWRWLVAGTAFSAFLIATQAQALGGLAGLLLVGEDAALRPFIEGLLGDIPLARGAGHDGQIYFAIAHDLDGRTVGDLVNNPGIRYRRPVLPWLASLGGLLSGSAVLWSTAAWISIGTGVTWMSFRQLLSRIGAPAVWMTPLIAYPGFWLAARLFTPDMIGFGAALLGLSLVLCAPDRLFWPMVLMSVAVLSKEAFVVIPLAIGTWQFFSGNRIKGIALAAVSTASLTAAVAVVLSRFDVEAVDGNFGLPFTGIMRASDTWQLTPASDRFYVYMTMALLVAGGVAIFVARSPLVRWLIAPWIAIAIISSEWIWEIGNGLARSFAPVAALAALGIAERVSQRRVSDG